MCHYQPRITRSASCAVGCHNDGFIVHSFSVIFCSKKFSQKKTKISFCLFIIVARLWVFFGIYIFFLPLFLLNFSADMSPRIYVWRHQFRIFSLLYSLAFRALLFTLCFVFASSHSLLFANRSFTCCCSHRLHQREERNKKKKI